ncbi:MAG: LCP family protein [Clostridia bacterium]|nr:LCP family protein [Clostridia bacterium]
MLKPNKRLPFPKRRLRCALWVGFIPSFVAMVLVCTIMVLMALGKSALLQVDKDSLQTPSDVFDYADDENLVIYKGKRYTFNENVTSILCIGVDKEEFAGAKKDTSEKGQADALFLISIDTVTGRTVILPISRETMTEIALYSNEGKALGSATRQICMAYAYGDGKKTSCENTVLSVSRLLYGIPINSYYAIDISAVAKLNDKLGGVTLTALEDMQLETQRVKAGQSVTLKGKNALAYIQQRGDDVNANNLRMQRQIQYLRAFSEKTLQRTRSDISTINKLYQTAAKYSVNNISLANIIYLAGCVMNNGTSLEFKSISGETRMGEEYVEFYPDATLLYETVLDIFYLEQQSHTASAAK